MTVNEQKQDHAHCMILFLHHCLNFHVAHSREAVRLPRRVAMRATRGIPMIGNSLRAVACDTISSPFCFIDRERFCSMAGAEAKA